MGRGKGDGLQTGVAGSRFGRVVNIAVDAVPFGPAVIGRQRRPC